MYKITLSLRRKTMPYHGKVFHNGGGLCTTNIYKLIKYMKHNITYRLDNKLNFQMEVAILLVLTFAGLRVTLSSGIHIRPELWDADARRPKKTAVNAAGQNAITIVAELGAKAKVLDEIFENLEKANRLSAKNIREAYRNANGLSSHIIANSNKVLPAMDDFVTEMARLREWTPATKEKFNALGNHIRAVDSDMTFDDLDDKGLAKLLDHFRTVTLHDTSVGMRNSTIAKQFGYLSWFLNWATKKGINTNDAYLKYAPSIKQTQKKVIYLTDAELELLATVDLSASNRRHLERIRDIFMYQCYSGLRYSDAANLRWSDIHGDAFTFTSVKTTDTITVELNRYTKAILDKYRPFSFPGNKVFPAPTNQEMNRYLKELCRLAGIDEPVSIVYYKGKERIDEVKPKYDLIGTHAGRRTFVVRALSLGISPYIVMQWTGHSSMNSMKPYMDIVDKAKVEAMDKFNI